MIDALTLVEAMTDEEFQLACRLYLDVYFPGHRDDQQPPEGDWATWLIQSGRGWGKTRTGAEWLADGALSAPGTRWAIVAPTFTDGRDTCIEGESGLLSVLRRRRPTVRWDDHWNRSLGELVLPNASRVKMFSSEKPDGLRGPQHHGAWCDEAAAWRNAKDTWDMLQFGLRLGASPRAVVTTTPKPVKLVRSLVDDPTTRITRGSTFDNASNLAPSQLERLRTLYEGTRLGRQELYGELLTDTPGALWTLALIEDARRDRAPALQRVVVAIDPAVTSGEDSDSTGIVAAGLGVDGHLYVLHDRTCRESPERWARRAIGLYDEVQGDRIVAEVNNGGDLVEAVLRTIDPSVPVRKVHASRGKRMRAEPVAALYEQGRVHHVGGMPELEDQMTTWTPDSADSPDRLDALVWALTDLAVEPHRTRRRSIANVSAA
jgi:predicted phage terminase large subunit-like protein